MNLPGIQQTPDDPNNLPPARKRRAKRSIIPQSANDRESHLDELARKISPSFDFFLFSLIAGIVFSLGLIFDAPALLVLGAVLAPTLTPILGISLGAVTGSTRYFGRSIAGIAIISVITFLAGIISGGIARFVEVGELVQIYFHSQLTWYNILVLAVGAILNTIMLVRSKRRVTVASVALAYELFTPLAVAGFGLGSGIPNLWPDGLVVFLIYLAWAALLGAVTLAFMGFRPLTLFGYTIGGVIVLIGSIVIIGVGGFGAAFWGQVALPTPSPSATFPPTPTVTPSLTPTFTGTPIPPTRTLPPTFTQSLTPSPSETSQPSPTPVFGIVNAPDDFGGASLREEPGFNAPLISYVSNGTLVEILGEKPTVVDGRSWLFVRIPDGAEGWMLQNLLLAATPSPNW